MPSLIRVLIAVGVFTSAPAWACGSGGCTTKPSEFSSSSSTSSQGSSGSSNYSPPSSSSPTFDSAPNLATAPQVAMPQALKGDPKKKGIDFDSLAASSPDFRAVMGKNSRLSPGGSPAARASERAIASGSSPLDAGQGVIRPASVRGARELAGTARTPRTIATGEVEASN